MMNRRKFLRQAGLSVLGVYTLGARAPRRADQGTMTVTAAGDCIITRRISVLDHEPFVRLMELFRRSDIGFGNCETTIHDRQGYPAPSGACGDLNLMSEPAIAEELALAGFNMMALANNHTGDYGEEGLLASIEHLSGAGIVPAGAGANLAQARAPAYRTVSSGRVALVACASTFRRGSEASPAHAEIRGRPGLSPLRVSRILKVRGNELEALRAIRRDLGDFIRSPSESDDDDRLVFLGNEFQQADEPGVSTEANPEDVREILQAVERARAEADLVIVSIHAHESGRSREEPADFLSVFARASVDAGADMFFGHGPHVLRGIEIYKGKPIFYSLGNFLFQAETIRQIPAEIYRTCGIESLSPSDFFAKVMGRMFEQAVFWESVAPRIRFERGRCTAIELYPIDLRWKLPPTQRGTPELAMPDVAETIFARLAALSEPFGTEIRPAQGKATVAL